MYGPWCSFDLARSQIHTTTSMYPVYVLEAHPADPGYVYLAISTHCLYQNWAALNAMDLLKDIGIWHGRAFREYIGNQQKLDA
eukprot:525773-Pleurochrysis_carterae.AAC.6